MIDGSNLVIFMVFFAKHPEVFKLEDGSLMIKPVFDGCKIFYTRHEITLNNPDEKRGSNEVNMKLAGKMSDQRFAIRVTRPPDNCIDLSSLQSAEKKLPVLYIIISNGAKKENLVFNQKMSAATGSRATTRWRWFARPMISTSSRSFPRNCRRL